MSLKRTGFLIDIVAVMMIETEWILERE